jgi:hypothetical protein
MAIDPNIINVAFKTVFAREATPAELELYANAVSLNAIKAVLYATPEYAAQTLPIARLYTALLGRDPDPDGLSFYINQIRDGKMTLESAAWGFLNSPEATSKFAYMQSDDLTFIQQLYLTCLHRLGEPDGIAFYLDQLAHGVSRAVIAVNFSLSPENVARVGNKEYAAFIFVVVQPPQEDLGDVTPPAPPENLDLSASDDTGSSTIDNITKNTSGLSISGLAEADSTVQIFDTDGTTVLATGVAVGGAFTLDIALTEGVHTITAKATDKAGNISDPSVGLAITVDTTPPAAPGALDLAAVDDTGPLDSDNITKNTSALTITGTADTGSIVTIYDTNGTTVLGSATAASGAFSIDIALSEGAHTITAKAADVAGNASGASGSLVITVDATAAATPTVDLDPLDDSGSSDTDNITSAISGLTISGSAETDSTVNIYDTNGTTLLGTTTAVAGTYTVDIALAEGAHTINVNATDLAGNISSNGQLAITVDSTPPAAPSTPDLATDDDTGISDIDDLTKNASDLTINGTAESGSTVTIYDSNGTDVLGSGIATGGNYSIDISLTEGVHTITAKAKDVAGNVGVPSSGLAITVDLTPPADPTGLDLDDADDTGDNKDNVTSQASALTISGTGTAGNRVNIYDTNGTTILGTVVAGGGGKFSVDITLTGDGKHTITAKSIDDAGNFSGASTSLDIVLDTSAPVAPTTLDLDTADDTGVSTSDNLTKNSKDLTITGFAEDGSTVTLYDTDGITVVGSGIATGGVFTIDLGTMSHGLHSITATATDLAGNESAASLNLDITVDTVVPNKATTLALDPADDSGTAGDFKTKYAAGLTITGTADAGETVTLYDTDGTTVLGFGTATLGGTFSIEISTLTETSHDITAFVSDAAGNVSPVSNKLTVLVDLTAPATPSDPNLAAADDTVGANTLGTNSDNITKNTSALTFSGTADANTTVNIYDGATLVGTDTVGGGGTYSVDLSLLEGTHTLTAKAVDVVGNESSASGSLIVMVDTTAPTITVGPTVTTTSISLTANETGRLSLISSGNNELSTFGVNITAGNTGTISSLVAQGGGSATTTTLRVMDYAGNSTDWGKVILDRTNADVITATASREILFGFAGADTFVLFGESVNASSVDMFADYALGSDLIRLGGTAAKWTAGAFTGASTVGWTVDANGFVTGSGTVAQFYSDFVALTGTAGHVAAFVSGGSTYLFGEGAGTGDLDNTAVQLVGVSGTGMTVSTTNTTIT